MKNKDPNRKAGKKAQNRRRGNHEGTIRVEPSGRYRAVITAHGKRISKTFDTKDECRDWMHEMKTEVDGGLDTKNLKMTMREFATIWLENKTIKRRPKTVIEYNDLLNRHILPVLGDRVLRDVDALMIEKFLNSLSRNLKKRLAESNRKGNGSRTVQFVYVLLHNIFHDATKKRLITFNPVDAVEKPTYAPIEKVRLTLKQRKQLLVSIEGDPLEALYALALTKGLREGELLGLRWCDIDWERKCLHIVQQAQRIRNNGLQITQLKTSKSRRENYFGDYIWQKLETQRENSELIKRFAGERWVEHGLVFPSATGGPIDPRNLLRKFKAVLKKATLPMETTVHDLRHAAITTLSNDLNAPPKVAQELAGHSVVSTTMNIYTDDAESEMKRQYSDAAEKLLFSA